MACEYEHYVHGLCVCMWTINDIRIMIVEGEHKKVGLVPTKWEHRKKGDEGTSMQKYIQ